MANNQDAEQWARVRRMLTRGGPVGGMQLTPGQDLGAGDEAEAYALQLAGPNGEAAPASGEDLPTNGEGLLPLTLSPRQPLLLSEEMPSHYDIIPGPLGTIVNGVPISGPGVPEPPQELIKKHWHVKFQSEKYGTFQMFYWQLIDGRCMSYHSPTKTWKIWKPKKHIVISRDPRVSNLRKLGRLNKRVEKMLKPFQPKPARTFPARQLARRYLSAAERKLLEAGGS